VTVSWHIKFGTVEMLKFETAATLLEAIKQLKKAYATRGFIHSPTYQLAGSSSHSVPT
jgi:hypothetical protein